MDRTEVLRYLRTGREIGDARVLELVDQAIEAVEQRAEKRTLYRIFDCSVDVEGLSLGSFRFQSRHLAKNLEGCQRVVLFGATLGLEVDRLIKAAAATDLSKAMACQAAAAAKIEEVCDELEETIRRQLGVRLRPRFSPGYFDLDITGQRKLFTLLDLSRRIGISLTERCQMVPTKSVTAFIGVEETT